MELWLTETLEDDPHDSLHEPLTAENTKGKESTFVARGDVISDMKDDVDCSCFLLKARRKSKLPKEEEPHGQTIEKDHKRTDEAGEKIRA